jgi:hypothetical protein
LPDQSQLLNRLVSYSAPGIPILKPAREIVVRYLRAMYPGPVDYATLSFEEAIGPLEWLESRYSECHIGGQGMRNATTLAAFDTLLAAVLNRPLYGSARVPTFIRQAHSGAREEYDRFYSLQSDSPNAYGVMASKLRDLHWPVVFISFNYDLLLDRVLMHQSSGVQLDYRVPNAHLDPFFVEGRSARVVAIKPHGSINWTWCTRCHELTIIGSQVIFSGAGCSKCGTTSATGAPSVQWPDGPRRTLLLRPSFFKPLDLGAAVWDALLREGKRQLMNALVWIFIGYSFPIADVWVRAWLRDASLSREGSPRVIVIDPGDVAIARFRTFFGRDYVEHRRQTFWEFAEGLSGALLGLEVA